MYSFRLHFWTFTKTQRYRIKIFYLLLRTMILWFGFDYVGFLWVSMGIDRRIAASITLRIIVNKHLRIVTKVSNIKFNGLIPARWKFNLFMDSKIQLWTLLQQLTNLFHFCLTNNVKKSRRGFKDSLKGGFRIPTETTSREMGVQFLLMCMANWASVNCFKYERLNCSKSVAKIFLDNG